MKEYTFDLQEISETAKMVITCLKHKVVLCYGKMGVGKTTLIMEIAKHLGVKESMQSPSYGIVNEYQSTNGIFYHIDLYRLNTLPEAIDLGIEEYLNGSSWCFIEWPEKVEEITDNFNNKLILTKNKNQSRTLQIK